MVQGKERNWQEAEAVKGRPWNGSLRKGRVLLVALLLGVATAVPALAHTGSKSGSWGPAGSNCYWSGAHAHYYNSTAIGETTAGGGCTSAQVKFRYIPDGAGYWFIIDWNYGYPRASGSRQTEGDFSDSLDYTDHNALSGVWYGVRLNH